MKNLEEKIIGKIVAEDYRAASVFQKYGIDFCCQGNRTINDACQKKNLDASAVVKDLNKISESHTETTTDYQSWPLDLLADYIEKMHHRYVEEKIPVLKQFLEKIAQVHGSNHPELLEIVGHFHASAGELTAHMKKEEFILFPYIRKMVKSKHNGEQPGQPNFGSVENPIQMLMQEHDQEGERFREISRLSNNYTTPEDACNTYKVAYATLREFENDLHLHIHLENNILFPKAAEMEKEGVYE